MSKQRTSARCLLCGGVALKDYEFITPKGRFIKSLCTECRDAVQGRGWPLRAYPPRRPNQTLWMGKANHVNAVAGPQTVPPRGVR